MKEQAFPLSHAAADAADEVGYLTAIIAIQTEIAQMQLNLDAIMKLVCQRAQLLARADGAVVEIAEGANMVYCSCSGAAEQFLGLSIPAQGSLSGLSVEKDEVLYCEDVETDTRVNREACRRVGILSMIVVPLQYNGKPVGVLKVFSGIVRQFNERDISSLQLMASLIGVAMGRAAEHETRQHLMDALSQSEERLAKQLELAEGLNSELENANERLGALAVTDGLTGLKNRRFFDEALEKAFAQEARRGGDLSLLLADVDAFKHYNDTHGHPAGDEVLKRVAEILTRQVRGYEIVARFGGEEFAIILPGADTIAAVNAAERIRRIIERGPWPLRSVTASVGVATMQEGCTDVGMLLGQADAALYNAKQQGRNRVAHYAEVSSAANPQRT